MVFESIVVDILNKCLGDYVENLDRSQLKIGIWGGDVTLKNLSLKPSALDELNLPVKTVYGHLGKLVLKIPWKNIYTAPVEVLVENLFLLANPIQDVTYDAEKEEKLRQEAKQAMINKVEEAKKKEKENANQQVNDTFVEKLAAQIIKNVQIFIGDIHVRYEDRITKPESPFSIGVSLHTLKIYTTNECCESYVVPENESPLFYKIMIMEGLSVYWNPDSASFANAENDGASINTLFVEGIASKTYRTVGYNYILGPINSEAKLQVNSKPELLNFITPKIFLSLVLERLLLNVRKSQYQDLIALLEQFDRMTKAAPYRKYRPDVRLYRGHYKEWWRFAISCALDDVKRRSRNWDWNCIVHHRKLCKRYEMAYRRKITEKPSEPLTKQLEQLERDLDGFDIILIRQKVENEVEREGRFNAEQRASKKTGGGWFSGWFSSASKTSESDREDQNLTSNIVKQFGNAMNDDEKQKLYRAIDYHESLIPTSYPTSFVAIRLEFVLKVLKIIIIDDDDDEKIGPGNRDAGAPRDSLMTVKFEEVLASINQRPAAQSYALSLTMQSFETLGMRQQGIVPKIIRSKLSASNENDDDNDDERRYFLNVFFETNPQDGQYDQRLRIILRPLKVVYDAQTVIKILQVFTPQNDITAVKNQLQAVANTKFEEMKEKSAVKLQYAIEKSTKLDLKVDLMAPYLILPFGGFYTNNEMALVINLGRITVVSKNKDNAVVNVKRMLKEGSSEDQVFNEMMAKCYDCFKICLGDVQILSLKAGQKWKPLIGSDRDLESSTAPTWSDNSDSHILQPTSVYVDIYKCVIDDDPRLPKIKIDGSLADVTVRITEKTLLEVVSLIISLPLPSHSVETQTTVYEHSDTVADDDDASTIYDSAASLRQKLESLNRLQFSTLKKYGKRTAAASTSARDEEDLGAATATATTTSSSNRMPTVDYINVEANFSLKGLTVYVQREQMQNPLAKASVVTLQLSFVQRTYSCEISAKLGKLSLLQNYRDSIIPAISTPVCDGPSSDQYLLYCKLIIAEKNSPVFEKIYNSTAVKLAVEFTKLYAIAHQDAIMDTIRWIGDLQTRIFNILSTAGAAQNTYADNDDGVAIAASNSASQTRSHYSAGKLAAAAAAASKRRKGSAGSAASLAVEKKCRKLKTKSALAAIVEDQLSDMTGSHSKAAESTRSSDAGVIVEFHVTACLDEIQVCLQTARRSLASMYVNGLHLSTRIDKSCTEIEANLHSISVCDLNDDTTYNKVAYIVEGKQAVKAVVTLYNEQASDGTRTENDFDVSLKIQMSSLHCVFINEFLVDVLHFANNFQTSKKMLAEVSAAAVASAKMNVQQVYQSSTRVHLDIFVDAPVILVPQNSRSSRVFIVDFGNLSVKNTLKKLPNPSASSYSQHEPLIDQVSLVLKDMQITRTNYERTDAEHTLLKPVNYQLVIKRNLSVTWFDQVADFDICGEFCPIHVTITAHDYDVVMKTLQENFGAQPRKRSAAGQKETREQLRSIDEQSTAATAVKTTAAPTILVATAEMVNEQDTITDVDVAAADITRAEYHLVSEEDEQRVRTMLKFEMTIESVTIDLYTVSSDKKDGLAKFTLSLLSVNGSLLTDTRFAVHASLSNCCVDDTRSSKMANPVKRYMQRKSCSTTASSPVTNTLSVCEAPAEPARSMVDVIFEKDVGHTNVKAHVYSFVLILNVDHITKIQEFFSSQSAVTQASSCSPSASAGKTAAAASAKRHDIASSQGVGVTSSQSQNQTVTGVEAVVLFSLILEKPDIILVENLDDIDTNAIILNNEANVRFQMSGDGRLAINAVLRDLQLYTCCYNPEKRSQSASLIVHPLSIDVNGASSENSGLHLDVNVSQVNVSITAGTIALLTNISSTLVPKMEDESSASESSSPDYSDVWNQKNVKDEYWFLEMEEGEDALLAYADKKWSTPPASLPSSGSTVAVGDVPDEKRVDMMTMAIPVVRVTLEAGIGKKTIPLLALNSSFRATVRRTVQHLTLQSFVSLEIGYYNTRLAMWEPIIEPILQPSANSLVREKCVPWKLQFQCKMLNKVPSQQNEDYCERNNDESNASSAADATIAKIALAEKEPLLSLHFNSDERIELTFTKSCMDVVKTLSQSFNDVVRAKCGASSSSSNSNGNGNGNGNGNIDEDDDDETDAASHEVDGSSCYVLVNDYGSDIRLSLADDQPFRLISAGDTNLPLSPTAAAAAAAATPAANVIVSPGCRVRLSKKKIVADINDAAAAVAGTGTGTGTGDDDDRTNNRRKDIEEERCLLDELNTITQRNTDFLRVTVVRRNKELALPVCRADKRYFAVKSNDGLSETWGLISEVDVVEGSVIVTVRSVVRIYNHFNVRILVYSMKNDKLELVGKVRPSQYLNVPVEAVYHSKGRLFFAPERYNVSAESIVWKELQKTVSFSKQVCCISKNSENEDPFFMRILGQMEQVYYENTTCYTVASTVYSIRLRPTLIFKNFLPVEVVCCLQGIAAEHRLQPGQNINVCTAEPDRSTIVLRLDNYLDKVWSCKKLIKSDAPIFSVWTFSSFDSEKAFSLNLGVWYSNCDDSMIFALYCPYWMVNKSGLNLSYKGVEDGGMILHHPASFEEPILFSFKEKSFFSQKKACVRVGDGDWSDKFSMDVAGNSGSVSCSYSKRIYQLGVYIRLNYNTLTKQVIFSPFFTVANNCPFAVELRESRIRDAAWIQVESGACIPFWPIAHEDADKVFELKITNTTQVTASFSYLKIGTHTLKLYNSYGGLQADVQVTEGGVYVAIAAFQPKMATALIINDTDLTFECTEVDLKSNARDPNSPLENYGNEIVSLRGKHQLLFNWSAANMDNPVLLTNASASHIDLRTDGVGELRKYERRIEGEDGDEEKKYWISFLNGMQRVLLITADPFVVKEIEAIADFEQTRQEIQLHLKGIGFSLVNNISRQELLYVSVSSSTVVWEVQKQSGKRFKPANEQLNKRLEEAFVKYRNTLRLAENDVNAAASLNSDVEIVVGKEPAITVNFSDGYIVKPSVKKIRRTYNNGLWLQIKSSERYKQIHAKVNRLQIDNQIYDCVFPVIFSPIPPPKSVANTGDENTGSARERPFAELSIVQRVDENAAGAVKQFKYFKVLVQEFHVKIDIGFVNAVVKFLEVDCVTDDEEQAQFRTDQNVYKEPLGVHISSVTSQDFYDLLHFSPLKIHVSFSLCGENPNDGTPQQGLPIVNLLTQSVGVTLTDVNDVVFRLAYFERKHTFYSQSQLMSEVKTHYIGQFVKQLYVLVLGLDVLGNPFGLVTGLKQGVEDFFYEPFQGAIQGPSEFAEGVLLGVRSLFGHTVGGAAGAVGRITGAMGTDGYGKGIAALTLDEEYQKKRRQRLAQQQTSFAEGGRGLVMGVVEGVGGVISKPISGAKEEGVEGFVKGVGKGVVGLFMRPASGVVDFASGTVDVVRRVATFSEEVGRYRLPRYFKENGLVVPYSRKDAQGIKLLLNTEKGKFMSTDEYVFHLPMADSNQPDKEVLLVTNNRVIYLVKASDIFSDSIKIEWQYTWNEIKEDGVAESEYGVSIRVDAGDSRRPVSSPVGAIGSLFKRSSKGKILIVSDKELRKWLIAKMRELVKKAHRNF